MVRHFKVLGNICFNLVSNSQCLHCVCLEVLFPLLLCSETVLVHIEAETQKNGNRCLLFQCEKTAGEGKGAEKM